MQIPCTYIQPYLHLTKIVLYYHTPMLQLPAAIITATFLRLLLLLQLPLLLQPTERIYIYTYTGMHALMCEHYALNAKDAVAIAAAGLSAA